MVKRLECVTVAYEGIFRAKSPGVIFPLDPI